MLKDQAVKLRGNTVEKLNNLEIEMQGVSLRSYDDKVNHLIWFFEHYKNSNGKPKSS